MSKYFIINDEIKSSTPEEINSIEKGKQLIIDNSFSKRNSLNESLINKHCNLKSVIGKVIITINLESKNSHTFKDGTKLYLGRQYNNLNRRETEPVNAIVVDSDYIPKNSEILIHHNTIHDSNKIFDYQDLSDEKINDIKYYSIPEEQCYLWKDENNEWQPLKGFATGLRIFEPYIGILEEILPKRIENVLYITSGQLKGKVCHTLRASDFEIIFQSEDGTEKRIIRLRHCDSGNIEREEIIVCDNILTKKVLKGELLIGLSPTDCKKNKLTDMNYEMYHDNVLILPTPQENKTKTGIIIPDTIQHNKVKGTVISVGEGGYDEKTGEFTPTIVKKNNEVLYNKDAGSEIEIDNIKYLIVKEFDILTIL